MSAWLAAPVELPISPRAVSVLVDTVARALPVDAVRLEVRDDMVVTLEQALGRPVTQFVDVSPPDLDAALAQHPTSALVLMGPNWRLRSPRGPGFLTAALPSLDSHLAGALFDLHLVEWGLGGHGEVPVGLRSTAVPAEPTAPSPLPGIEELTYLSADLAHQADLPALASTGVQRLRTATGGALLGLVGQPAAALEVPLAAPLRGEPRPPIDMFPQPQGPLFLRDVSPGLAAWLRGVIGAAVAAVPGADATLEGLGAMDRAFAVAPPPEDGPVLEGWGALAGELMVGAGGRWRRRLDPLLPYPASLAVQTAGGALVAPHGEAMGQVRRGQVAGLSAVIGRHLG